MPGLDPDSPEPAYHLGRLFYVLTELEGAAHQIDPADGELFGRKFAPSVHEPTYTLRWSAEYGPRLLTRLSRTRPAVARRYSDTITALVDRIGDVKPMVGNSAHQSLFTVGYHHERFRATTLTTSEVAQRYGYASTAAARAELSRLGLRGSRDGATGEHRWVIVEVEAARKRRPGRGARTDLVGQPDAAPVDKA